MIRVKIARLPRTDGMRNKVLMATDHRFIYDHAIRMVGAQIVEYAPPPTSLHVWSRIRRWR